MAGLPWFELDTDFHESPKVRALASRLREPLADAYVSRLYAYCYRHAREAFDSSSAADVLEEAMRWKGRRGTLFDALMAVGVLERGASNKVVVHGIQDRLGPHLAKREADRLRIAERREKTEGSIKSRGSVARTSPRRPPDVAGNKDKDRDELQPPIPPADGEQQDGVFSELAGALKARVRPDLFAKWFAPLRGQQDGDALVLEAPDAHHRDFIADNYATFIAEELHRLGHHLKIHFNAASEAT